MPEQTKYTDLLTPDELKGAALNSLSIDPTDSTTVSGLGSSYKDECILAIRDVTGSIQSYLDRKLMVRKWNHDFADYKWAYNRALDKYQVYPDQYPVVQTETSGVTISNDSVRLLSDAREDEVIYYAGYKRRDQTVGDDSGSDIDTAANGLDGLTETPDDLPHDIRRVAFRLVMFELQMTLQNTFATASVTKQSGQTSAEITRTRENVYDKELRKLETHKRLI